MCLYGVAGRFGLRIIEWFAWWKPVAAARYVVANNEIDVYARWIVVRKLVNWGSGI